jgi:hypothetical protein
VPVRREDQEKINRFSRLHQREAVLEQQLKQKRVSVVCGNFFIVESWCCGERGRWVYRGVALCFGLASSLPRLSGSFLFH